MNNFKTFNTKIWWVLLRFSRHLLSRLDSFGKRLQHQIVDKTLIFSKWCLLIRSEVSHYKRIINRTLSYHPLVNINTKSTICKRYNFETQRPTVGFLKHYGTTNAYRVVWQSVLCDSLILRIKKACLSSL